MSSEARQLIEGMTESFMPEKAGTAKALIDMVLTGDGGGEWTISIADGQCTVAEEAADKPDVKVTMDNQDFVLLTQKRLNPVQAFMGGKIKVSGNVGLVMQMINWFNLG